MNLKSSIIVFVSQIICCYIFGQNQEINFNAVKGNDGESLGKITAITQDRYGYMWFSGQTAQCLYRYDGNRIKTFRQDTLNPNSLGGTNLETVYADDSGYIWIGFLGTGLDQFNPATGKFKHFRFTQKDNGSLGNDTVSAIIRDHEGALWVGTNGGLDRLDEKSGKFIHYTNQPGNSQSLSNNVVRVLYVDHKGVLWVGTGWPFNNLELENGGLNRLEPNGKFTRFMHDSNNPHSLINNKVRAIFEDSRGIFWVGTAGDGLHTMDREKGTFERHLYNAKKPDQLSRPPLKSGGFDHITFICEDGSGAIWIGSFSSGINRYDTLTKKITQYQANNGFPDVTGWMAYKSRDGVLWISTQEENLYRVDPFRKKINSINTGGTTGDILEDKEGFLWVGTWEKGLQEYDKNYKLIHQFNHVSSDTSSLFNNIIFGLFQNQKDSIWLCTASGIEIFDKANKKFHRLPLNVTYNEHVGFRVVNMLQDNRGIKWFASDNGLIKYAPDGSVKQYLHDTNDTNSISDNEVLSVSDDRNDFIWAGVKNGGGINLLNRKTGRFSHYLKGYSIYCLYQDPEGTIWAGTEKSLYSFNKSSNTFLPFFDPHSEFAHVGINFVIEDNLKNLWISTPSFILKIDSSKREKSVYGNEFGIVPNSLGTIYKISNGKILILHNSGFYAFYPTDLAAHTPNSKILITDFFINNLPVLEDNKSSLLKPLEETNKIELKYNQNAVAFNFAVIDYRAPETYKYSSMLENYDNTWRPATGEKAVFYINLPAGKYIFHVRAINIDGIEFQKSLQIIIAPPWWKTWWAYALYSVLFVTAIWAFIAYRSRTLKKQNRILEDKVTNRTEQLKKSFEELKATQAQLIQSEKMASLGELTAGIAHEIQNPLNFVNNFSEVSAELLDEMAKEFVAGNKEDGLGIASDIKQNLEKIIHHGKRADAIVKGMLQHSKVSSGQKELTDIQVLANEHLRLSYHGFRAKDKSFNTTIQTDFDASIGKINIIPQDIGRVLLNMYNNAFYAVTEKKKQLNGDYEPTVSVSTKKVRDEVFIKVKDNGNGIPQKVIDKIFQPFFTTKPTGQGTGLGLSLSYDIIKANDGEIRVETKEGEGAEFVIKLPI